jgi:basic membrane lipoprotein Med (substrate-binding protein (PBP1-ABC) superfamily)
VILGVMLKYIAFTFVILVLFLCSCRNNKVDVAQSSDAQTEDTLKTITADMAYEGINNYCHSAYDWSVAKDNPDIMYLTMGEETDSTYQVVFRSYTGAFVHFYVNKTSGTTRMVEKVPSLNIEEEVGTIELFDYLEKQN